jgi:hypothetical protein
MNTEQNQSQYDATRTPKCKEIGEARTAHGTAMKRAAWRPGSRSRDVMHARTPMCDTSTDHVHVARGPHETTPRPTEKRQD